MRPRQFFLLLALAVVSAVLLTAQAAQQPQRFQLPKDMYGTHEGRPVADIGLDQNEISTLLSMALAAGLGKDDMRSPAALRKELLARRVDMGEGADHGLVLQGNDRLCGGTGNCATWFFRKEGTDWKLLEPKNYAPQVSEFGFLSLKHNDLNDLVVAYQDSSGTETIELLEFNGSVYESKESFCQRGDGFLVLGECE
jgi:hypothetical protein